MKFEISLFRFDYKSDYVPFYKKYFIKTKNEKTLLDLLNTMNEEDEFFYDKNEDSQIILNNLVVDCSINLEEIYNNFNNELIIEPLSKRRAMTDLIINDNDFYERLEILDEFLDEDDKVYYKSLKKYYYASNTLNFEKNYIGDSTLLLADYIIEKKANLKNKILKVIKQYPTGIQYHTSLKNRIFNFDENIENKILKLKKELNFYKKDEEQNFKINKTTNFNLKELSSININIKNNFKDFNISYYGENNHFIKSYLKKLACKIIDLDTKDVDLNKSSFHINKNLTFKIAGEIIQEAFDKGSDFLVVNNIYDFYIFDYNRKELKKQVKREINLPILHLQELNLLVEGNFNEANNFFKKHSINPGII
ncbi:hypothetical protein CRV00_13670 [Malaciobacter molluscorum]|uniref:HdrB C-terminal domain-containing protein n=1 Tax=Malaciobacter molluscorum TaxID=1032072 RepID=UPI00100A7752|nr:DUF5644 domain-containing protein [Malaciobacter molluscorum]RXJ91939.1 hypothetical protein CRV00_13670 [Malaciobacter molluscorum]